MSKIYKFVPFQFFYNASTLKSLTKILKSCNNTFEFNSITGKKSYEEYTDINLKKRDYISSWIQTMKIMFQKILFQTPQRRK